MTDDNIIQQARDVLAKWRAPQRGVTRQPWFVSFKDEHGWVDIAVQAGGVIDGGSGEGGVHAEFAPLIVGTAGNPDLLDALDYLLEAATIHESRNQWSGSVPHAERLAAAIIAADERMTS